MPKREERGKKSIKFNAILKRKQKRWQILKEKEGGRERERNKGKRFEF